MRIGRLLLIGICLWLLWSRAGASDIVNVASTETVEVMPFEADGQNMVLAVPSGHGLTDGLTALAKHLRQQSVTVWLVDPFTTWLLPELPSSLEQIPVEAYAALIQRAHEHAQAQGKTLFLFAFDRGVVRLLEAARLWQQHNPGSQLGGVMLLSPDLYQQTPVAGQRAQFLPIAQASNLPVFLFVPERSTQALRLTEQVATLEQGGSDVFVQILPKVRNRFFFRPDASDMEKALAARLPAMMQQAMRLLLAYAGPRTAMDLPAEEARAEGKHTGRLLPYSGSLQPTDFERRDLDGHSRRLSDERGRVVLLNFWASWCPPCVHEMPSMNRLQQAFDNRPLAIVAVNLGEEPEQIRDFLRKHPVNFSILLDPDQSLARRWQVFAFPTSYLLDKQGRIRYSVAGGLDWNSTEARQIIETLLQEQGRDDGIP